MGWDKKEEIKRGGFGVHKKPPDPPKPKVEPFKKISVRCPLACIGKVSNVENNKGARFAKCSRCKQVFRYMPKKMKPKIWYTSFGPAPS